MSLSSWFLDPPLWLQLAIAGAWLGLVGLTAEILHRNKAAGPETVRKVVHIGAGNVILIAWWLGIPAWVGIGVSIVASIITFLSYYLPILPSISGIGRKSLGTFFYAVSIGVLVGWFWTIEQPQFAALGILVMTWGDGLACIVGQRFGTHPYKIWDMQKSWEGSLAMFLVSFVVSGLILLGVYGNLWQIWLISCIVALFATGLEAFSKFGIDNLTVPLGSAALSFAFSQFLLAG
nr:diacylglycerol/polyprenol kinase family protein [Kovacikia minuta]